MLLYAHMPCPVLYCEFTVKLDQDSWTYGIFNHDFLYYTVELKYANIIIQR